MSDEKEPQTINLNIDGRALMNWLVAYSREVGGVPLVIRPDEPTPKESGGVVPSATVFELNEGEEIRPPEEPAS